MSFYINTNIYFRYGYRPIPSEIDTAELELLRDALVSMGNDVGLLDKWYRKDNNKVGYGRGRKWVKQVSSSWCWSILS